MRMIYSDLYAVFNASLKKLGQTLWECGITPAQLGVLLNISTHGATMTDLVRRVGCAPSNMTSRIRLLERNGYVETQSNPVDQRETLAFLTPTGHDILDKARPIYAQYLKESYGHLSPAEQMMLHELLDKVRNRLED